MKRSFKYLIMLCVLLLPIRANALTGSVSIECSPASISIGGTTTCTVKGHSDASVTSFEASVAVSGGIEVSSFTVGSSFYHCDNNGVSCDYVNNKISAVTTGVKDDFVLGTFVLKTSSSAQAGTGKLSLTSISFYDSNDEEASVSNSSRDITITKLSGLSKLTVTNGSLNKAFASNVFSYAVTLDKSATSFTINATPNDSSDTVVLYNESKSDSNKLTSNTIEFKPATGKNNMEILVVVGSVEYDLIVQKPAETPSSLLSALSVNGVSVNLKGCTSTATDMVSCSVTIPSSPTSYTVKATLSDSSSYKLDSSINNGSLTYPNGDKNFSVRVIPKDSSSSLSSMTYYVVVNRTSSPSNPGDVPSNPKTGVASFVVILGLLLLSILSSIMIYKRRIVSADVQK